jgi:hypothetical protein
LYVDPFHSASWRLSARQPRTDRPARDVVGWGRPYGKGAGAHDAGPARRLRGRYASAGALAGAAEFIPYVGALTLVVILALAGLVTFDHVGHALLVPGAYLVVTLLQANVVTPMVLGRRLALNPVAIFIGLAFWLWIWGLPGAFIAVPLLATLKICCDHIEMLAPVGEFLGE